MVVVFDRIDNWDNGKWSITDYKTSKREPQKEEVHRSIQFTIYSFAARKIFEEEFGCPESAIYYYHLRSGRIFKTQRDKKDFEYLRRLVRCVSLEIDHALKTGDFIANYGYHCQWCRFNEACQKYVFKKDGPAKTQPEGLAAPVNFDDWENLEEMCLSDKG